MEIINKELQICISKPMFDSVITSVKSEPGNEFVFIDIG